MISFQDMCSMEREYLYKDGERPKSLWVGSERPEARMCENTECEPDMLGKRPHREDAQMIYVWLLKKKYIYVSIDIWALVPLHFKGNWKQIYLYTLGPGGGSRWCLNT